MGLMNKEKEAASKASEKASKKVSAFDGDTKDTKMLENNE